MFLNLKNTSKDELLRIAASVERASEHPLGQSIVKKGIEDGLSDEYRLAYDSANKYQYTDVEKLKKRAQIDKILNLI